MNMIQRMSFRWNQPSNEGLRLVLGLALNLSAIAACLWVLWQCVQVLVH